MKICAYEDRPSDLIGLKLLVLSVLRRCPDASIELTVPGAPDAFVRWAEARPNVVVRPEPIAGRAGYDIKPYLLLKLLESGEREAIWIDSDIIVTGDVRRFFANLHDTTIVVAEEYFGARAQGGTIRTEGFGLPIGRPLPSTVNSCVVRVTPAHRRLLMAWDTLLSSEAYRSAQAKRWDERPLSMLGDQDVLTALLGSAEFMDIPIRWIRRGAEIAHCFQYGGYAAHERLRNVLLRSAPAFVHSQGQKPWRPPDGARTLHLELSPYTLAALDYVNELGEESTWASPTLPLARLLRRLFRDDITTSGLAQAIAAEAADQRVLKTFAKRLLGLDR